MAGRTETFAHAGTEFSRSFGNQFLNYGSDMDERSDYLAQIAGQICYLSLGKGRTSSDKFPEYILNLLKSGHGSVLEHISFSYMIWGVSRSLTHELVRHRAGFAFSQVSQRYVDNTTLRFVERPEFQSNSILHNAFIERIERTAKEYDDVGDDIASTMPSWTELHTREERRTLRKRVNQAARAVLTNETEAPIMVTANARAWRHFLEMRGSKFAEPEIRILAHKLMVSLRNQSFAFQDFVAIESDDDRYPVLTCEYHKV